MSIYEAIIVTVIATVISAPIVAFIVWLARLIWSKVEVRFIYPYKMWVGEGAYDPDMPDGSFVFHKRKIKRLVAQMSA